MDKEKSTDPLHGEEPYGTPPYGQPGPWAPAPPVQRPDPTPPAGTHLPPGPAAHGVTPPGGTAVPPGGTTTLPGQPSPRYDPWAAPGTTGAFPAPGAPADPVPGGRRTRLRLLAGAALVALAAGILGGVIGVYLERNGAFSDVTLPQTTAEESPPPEGSIAGIASQVLPGVVTLHVSGAEAATTGTGFVLDEQGHILTNAHVVAPAERAGVIDVTFSSGDTAQAEVIGLDSGYDLAVVKVSGVSGLTPLELGDSDAVHVGDPVVAIGAPFDLQGTVTSGIISATERPITAGGSEPDGSDISYVNALQTDAPINPGNSGGPLVDVNGRVIGVNSAIRTADGAGLDTGQAGSVGLGFAIPINQAREVAEQLINDGYATHPVIGVTLDTSFPGEGALVGSTTGEPAVSPGGPADEAGIEEGDVITEVDGERVRSADELIVRIRSHRPGDELVLTLERDGEEMTVPVVLGEERGQ
ncbi:S1C family serine protease [Streptomyces sp. 7-21]|uniref:S1C family serine protease n=1 Tax=Streptomyces sp. 7-21 TaxID=2802283 RepID=UPI001F285073|nr:trypsin-like peptidase domain-containing protein [Streptomyces sp. 7-21]